MIGNQWKPIGEALIDGEAVETGVPLRAKDYDVKLTQRNGELFFTITRRETREEG